MTRFLSTDLHYRAAVAVFGLASSLALAQDGHDDHAHPVEAAAHGEPAGVIPTPEQGIVPMIVAIVVFAIVLAIVSAAIWPKIVKGLDERAGKIREEIELAEQARKQAKEALEEYERSAAKARSEAQKMLEQTRAQQTQLAAELKAKADVELGQLRERAMRDIETAKRAAIAEIYNEAAALATSAAGKILRKEIRPDDQRALVEESVRALQTVKN
ncbi:MAG: hypothetical protein AMXMBFR58_15160 [Phycisphaerae bacterium]